MKGKIIILESSPACGKSSCASFLRENIKYSTLISLNGLPSETDNPSNAYLYHSHILNCIDDCNQLKQSFILCRSFVSNTIYCRLGFKDYSFEKENQTLMCNLRRLSKWYDIYYITVTANEEVLKERLKRNKSEYIKYSVENSLQQQEAYLKFHNENKVVNYMKFMTIDTSNKKIEEIGNEILEMVGEKHESN